MRSFPGTLLGFKKGAQGVLQRNSTRTGQGMVMVLCYASWRRRVSFLPVVRGALPFSRSRPSSPDRLCRMDLSAGVRPSSLLPLGRFRTSIYRALASRRVTLGLSIEILWPFGCVAPSLLRSSWGRGPGRPRSRASRWCWCRLDDSSFAIGSCVA